MLGEGHLHGIQEKGKSTCKHGRSSIHAKAASRQTVPQNDAAGAIVEDATAQAFNSCTVNREDHDDNHRREDREETVGTTSRKEELKGNSSEEPSRCESMQDGERIFLHEDSDGKHGNGSNDTDAEPAASSEWKPDNSTNTTFQSSMTVENVAEQRLHATSPPSSINDVSGCKRALMEGVALIILEFIFLHCDLAPKRDQFMALDAPPLYHWDRIRNVMGAASVVIPTVIFRECLKQPKTNVAIVALQEQVGEAMKRVASEERRHLTVSGDLFTSKEFELLYEFMLFHNLRRYGILTIDSNKTAFHQTVPETLRNAKKQFEKEPLSCPAWYKLSDASKYRKLASAERFLENDLALLVAKRQRHRFLTPRLEHLAKILNTEDQDKFFGLSPIKTAVGEGLDEARNRSKERRSQTPSPLRTRRDSLAEPKSKNMLELIKAHNSRSGKERRPR